MGGPSQLLPLNTELRPIPNTTKTVQRKSLLRVVAAGRRKSSSYKNISTQPGIARCRRNTKDPN